MTKELDLQNALAALEQYGYDKKHSTDLEQARNKQQMAKYIDSLDFSLRRLELLQEVVTEAVCNKKRLLAQKENIQTYKTKIINLSREWNMSYQDVIDLMAKVEK
ncbi:MAG: hypothetical protein LPD71_01290 [Shewanella sp.]|nr:hypothetical protein [Shewanella sp.]MCF1429665.1 hypothetical protein [Shewanella sp.]MCF1437419.1 hypothetical protein [Shewanella sp.]MCF1456299.1 hypothetical protein [Shewanella sp.]